MGDNVIDDAQIIFEVAESTAGGTSGKLILNSVTLTVDRPTNGYSGIGNDTEVAVGYGTLSASLDHEQVLNEEAAALLERLYRFDRSPKEMTILAGDVLEARATKFDWNNLEVSAEDDGDVMVSVSGKVRGLDIDAIQADIGE